MTWNAAVITFFYRQVSWLFWIFVTSNPLLIKLLCIYNTSTRYMLESTFIFSNISSYMLNCVIIKHSMGTCKYILETLIFSSPPSIFTLINVLLQEYSLTWKWYRIQFFKWFYYQRSIFTDMICFLSHFLDNLPG